MNKNNIDTKRGETFVGYRPSVIKIKRIKKIQDKQEKMKQEKELMIGKDKNIL